MFPSVKTYLGNYTCTAQNRFGTASVTSLLRGNAPFSKFEIFGQASFLIYFDI